ncbi:MAG: hypothetical protein NTAFB01_41300 [Nitrospira sp.]
MPVSNSEIAEILIRLADLLEIDDANPFRVRAYRKAARTLESLPCSAASMLNGGADLSDLPGIGTDLADKIDEIIKTRHLTVLDEVESRLPSALAELRRLPGLGPKRVKTLYERLNIKNLEELARATEAGKLHDLSGFGRKIEETLLQAIRRRRQSDKRLSLLAAEQIADPLLEYLKKIDGVREVIVAGSYRRRKETVGDLDILVTCRGKSQVMDRFIVYEESDKVALTWSDQVDSGAPLRSSCRSPGRAGTFLWCRPPLLYWVEGSRYRRPHTRGQEGIETQ